MSDKLFRFTFEDSAIRGEIVVLSASWHAAMSRHEYAPAVMRYLGDALAATTLLSGTIKFKGSLILQLQGDGALRTLVAQATDSREIRGMAHATTHEVPDDRLAEALGNGRMVLSAEGLNGERYQGIVAVEGARLADAVETYFTESEQLASRVWLATDEKTVAGLLLQRLPGQAGDLEGADEDWRRICLLAETIRDTELLGLPPEKVLHRLFHEETLRLYEPESVSFRCACSRKRISQALLGLGRDEVDAIIAERGTVDADCEFCNAHYSFDAVDIAALFSDATSVPPPDSTQ